MAHNYITDYLTFTAFHHTGSGTLIEDGYVIGPSCWKITHTNGVIEVLTDEQFALRIEETV